MTFVYQLVAFFFSPFTKKNLNNKYMEIFTSDINLRSQLTQFQRGLFWFKVLFLNKSDLALL